MRWDQAQWEKGGKSKNLALKGIEEEIKDFEEEDENEDEDKDDDGDEDYQASLVQEKG